MEQKRFNKKVVLGIIAFLVVVVSFVALYMVFRPKAEKGSKHITIEVVDDQMQSSLYDLYTDAEYLREAMDEAEGLTYAGEEGAYGVMLLTVNGVTADYNVDQSYWCIYVNGEYGNYGIDTQPICDKDAYKLEYIKYAE